MTTTRTLAAALSALALAAGAAACGDEEESASAGPAPAAEEAGGSNAQAEAKAAIEAAKAIPDFTLKAEPFDVSKLRGKTVYNIPLTSAIPYLAAVDKEMQRVSEAQGVKFVEHTNEGTPTQWAAGINQAIEQKADVIVLQGGLDPQLVIPQLQRAKEAGIPVLVAHLYENGEEPPAKVKDLVSATVTVPFAKSGELSVDYAIAQDGCDVEPLIINAKEVYPSNGIVKAMKARLAERCPDAEAEEINVPATEWGTKMRPEVQSALTRNPSTDWILPIYDSMSIGAEAAVRAAGKTGQVKIASYNGTPDILKLIQDGDTVVADMGENINWLGWANMDQAFRLMAGAPLVEGGNAETPLRVIDDSNVDETGKPPTPDKGYGDAYVTGYEQLWGVK